MRSVQQSFITQELTVLSCVTLQHKQWECNKYNHIKLSYRLTLHNIIYKAGFDKRRSRRVYSAPTQSDDGFKRNLLDSVI